MGQIVEATLIGDFDDVPIILWKKFAGMANPYSCEVFDKSNPKLLLEKIAEGGDTHVSNGRYFGQADVAVEMIHDVACYVIQSAGRIEV